MLPSTIGLLLQLLGAPPQLPDTAAILRAARNAQQRFESSRRARLPIEWGGGSGGRCDARIGRYCYWYDSSETKPVPEPRPIAEARERLIAALDSGARRSPRDGWIAGQRVRYLLEAHRADSAFSAARQCDAERWWCSALAGLALQVGERFAAADSAFSHALETMPDAQRCEWLDVRELLSARIAGQLDRADCAERGRLGDRLAFYGQPLWMVPGREWRTEIFARHTMVAILARVANPHGAWGDDQREMLMRYGWPEWFTRSESAGLYATPNVSGHDREPSYDVFPAVASVRTPRLAGDVWRLRAPLAQSRYSPRSLERLGALRHQLARFPRGDSVLLAVRFATADTAMERDSTTAAVNVLVRDSMQRAPLTESRGTILVPADTLVVSVEVLGRPSRHGERARYSVDPLPRVGSAVLSDLLLFAPDAGNPLGIDSVLPRALPGLRVSAREPFGVYWELDGVRRENAVLSVTVEPLHVGVVRRVATRLRLAPELAPVRVRWQSMVASRDGEHVTLRMPANARGLYRVVLTVQQASGPQLTSSREIDVVP